LPFTGIPNPNVQPAAIRYTITPASHIEGDGISMAHNTGKNHENYT